MDSSPQTRSAQVTAVLNGAGLASVSGRAILRITGSDATRWLNGMVTNSIQTLGPGEGCYNFLLNAQGRIQGDCTIYRDTDGEPAAFLLVTTGDQVDAIQNHLDRFIIMDDVELTPAYTDDSGLLILGPKTSEVLQSIGLPSLDPMHLVHADSPHGPVLCFTPASGGTPRVELRAPAAVCNALSAALELPQVSTETLEELRLLEGRPVFGKDIRDRDLPQETGQVHALHFAKGCYLGQEIVERIRSRGQVHRQFVAFRLNGEQPESLPAPLEANGKPAGEITSASLVQLAEGPTLLALGYARREALDTRQQLTYAGGIATPHHTI